MVKPIFSAPLFVNGRTYTAKSVNDTNYTIRRVCDDRTFFALRTDDGFKVDGGEVFPAGVFDAFAAAAKKHDATMAAWDVWCQRLGAGESLASLMSQMPA